MKKLFFLMLLSSGLSFAAFNSTAVWEVRTTGNDGNGGAFDPGVSAPGTDETLTPTTCTTDIVIGSTTTQATAATCAFTATTHGPGNFIDITGGSGCTVQRVEMISQSAGTATFDKSLGTAASTCTGVIGGPLLTLSAAFTAIVAGNDIWVQAGTFSISSGLSWTTACTNAAPCRLMGYTTTRGDEGRFTIQASVTISTMLADSGSWHTWRNVIIDSNSKATTSGANVTGTNIFISNSIFKNFTAKGIGLAANGIVLRRSQVTGGASCTAGIITQGRVIIDSSEVNANACPGIQELTTAGLSVRRSLIHDNTGASSDGIQITAAPSSSTFHSFEQNSIYNNGRDGIRSTVASGLDATWMVGNIISKNAGNGITSTTTVYSNPFSDYNAFWNNGGDTGATTTHNWSGWGYGPHDFCAASCGGTIAGDPYTSGGTGDFSLNNTSGAGAALRAASFPGLFLGGTTTGFLDVGAAQHQDTGTSGGTRSYANQ
jgi:hypothetical protein